MDLDIRRKTAAILKVLADVGGPLGSTRIARELALRGIDLRERMVRYYLGLMDEQGFTENLGRPGRRLTTRGRREAELAVAIDRVGFVSARVDELAYRLSFDLESRRGQVILNVTALPSRRMDEARTIVRRVLAAGLGMGECIVEAQDGLHLGGVSVPKGYVGLGTVCSVTINGVFRSHGIPMSARFGGLLELRDGRPQRFSHIINYDGTTIDPIEIFIRGRMTRVADAARTGTGVIGAGFREIPAVALPEALELIERLKGAGLGGVLMVGSPGKALLDVPIAWGRVGVVVAAGLNPIAALEEAGIETDSRAMAVLTGAEHLTKLTRP